MTRQPEFRDGGTFIFRPAVLGRFIMALVCTAALKHQLELGDFNACFVSHWWVQSLDGLCRRKCRKVLINSLPDSKAQCHAIMPAMATLGCAAFWRSNLLKTALILPLILEGACIRESEPSPDDQDNASTGGEPSSATQGGSPPTDEESSSGGSGAEGGFPTQGGAETGGQGTGGTVIRCQEDTEWNEGAGYCACGPVHVEDADAESLKEACESDWPCCYANAELQYCACGSPEENPVSMTCGELIAAAFGDYSAEQVSSCP